MSKCAIYILNYTKILKLNGDEQIDGLNNCMKDVVSWFARLCSKKTSTSTNSFEIVNVQIVWFSPIFRFQIDILPTYGCNLWILLLSYAYLIRISCEFCRVVTQIHLCGGVFTRKNDYQLRKVSFTRPIILEDLCYDFFLENTNSSSQFWRNSTQKPQQNIGQSRFQCQFGHMFWSNWHRIL